MANLTTKAGIGLLLRVHAPLISLTRADIIRRGLVLRVDYPLTRSCYDPLPDRVSCGECDSCQLRLKGFREAGAANPIPCQQR